MSKTNIARLIANDVINELYDVVKIRPEMLVTNWLGFAYFTICKEIASLYKEECGCIDTFLSDNYMSDFIKEYIKINPNWIILKDWHFYHSNRAQMEEYSKEYDIYISQTKLELAHYTLEQ